MADFNNDVFEFEEDMRSVVYNAIAKVCFDWRNYDFSEEQIRRAVDGAIDWWDARFFEFDYYDDDE